MHACIHARVCNGARMTCIVSRLLLPLVQAEAGTFVSRDGANQGEQGEDGKEGEEGEQTEKIRLGDSFQTS